MRLNIPTKMQDILDSHKFRLILNNENSIIIEYVSSIKISHSDKILIGNEPTIDNFIIALDKLYENIDLAYTIDAIWEGDIKYDISLSSSDMEKSYTEYYNQMKYLINDLWENCPRIDSNQNYLLLIEERF